MKKEIADYIEKALNSIEGESWDNSIPLPQCSEKELEEGWAEFLKEAIVKEDEARLRYHDGEGEGALGADLDKAAFVVSLARRQAGI